MFRVVGLVIDNQQVRLGPKEMLVERVHKVHKVHKELKVLQVHKVFREHKVI